jgi:hypothetical protein
MRRNPGLGIDAKSGRQLTFARNEFYARAPANHGQEYPEFRPVKPAPVFAIFLGDFGTMASAVPRRFRPAMETGGERLQLLHVIA